jgi:hypothetical protein
MSPTHLPLAITPAHEHLATAGIAGHYAAERSHFVRAIAQPAGAWAIPMATNDVPPKLFDLAAARVAALAEESRLSGGRS